MRNWEPKPLWYGVGRQMYIDALRQSDGFCNRSNTRQKARRCASSALRSRGGDGGEGGPDNSGAVRCNSGFESKLSRYLLQEGPLHFHSTLV